MESFGTWDYVVTDSHLLYAFKMVLTNGILNAEGFRVQGVGFRVLTNGILTAKGG